MNNSMEVSKDNYERIWNKAIKLAMKEQYTEAIDLLNQVDHYISNVVASETISQDTIDFEKAMLYSDLMCIYCYNKNYQDALINSKKSIMYKKDSYLPTVYYNTGNIYFGLEDFQASINRYDQAIDEFKKLHLSHNKESADFLANKWEALYRIDKFKDAENLLLESISINPKIKDPYLYLSKIYQSLNKLEESFKTEDFTKLDEILREKSMFLTTIESLITKQILRIRTTETSPKNSKLYFALLLETNDLIKSTMSLLELFKEFNQQNKK